MAFSSSNQSSYEVMEYIPKWSLWKFVQEVCDTDLATDVDKDQKIIADTIKLIGNSGYRTLISMDIDEEQPTEVQWALLKYVQS